MAILFVGSFQGDVSNFLSNNHNSTCAPPDCSATFLSVNHCSQLLLCILQHQNWGRFWCLIKLAWYGIKNKREQVLLIYMTYISSCFSHYKALKKELSTFLLVQLTGVIITQLIWKSNKTEALKPFLSLWSLSQLVKVFISVLWIKTSSQWHTFTIWCESSLQRRVRSRSIWRQLSFDSCMSLQHYTRTVVLSISNCRLHQNLPHLLNLTLLWF